MVLTVRPWPRSSGTSIAVTAAMNQDSSDESDTGERVLPSSIHCQGRSSDGGMGGTATRTVAVSSGSSSTALDVLSRTSLYTSMAAYNNTKGIDPAEYMRNQVATPKSIQESTLIEMWRQVSADYHRGTTIRGIGSGRGGDDNRTKSSGTFSNHGARPVTVQDIEDTLRHRAITLVGGGFHRKVPRAVASKPTTKRRTLRAAGRRKIPSSKDVPPKVYRSQMLFLRKMHREWIRHAWEVLDGTSAGKVQQRLAGLASPNAVEWIGSKVRIEECREQPSRIGRTGILVAETTNTWRVAAVPDDFDKDVDMEAEPQHASYRLQSFVLPKTLTTLAVLLPVKPSGGDHSLVAPSTICIELNETNTIGT